MTTKLKDFTAAKARPLPVILLLDTSGSMNGIKMDSLNDAVHEMLKTFQDEEDIRAEVHLSIITFGGSASIYADLKPVNKFVYKRLSANGNTPMGSAFSICQRMLEDKDIIPGRAYAPTVVLVSDGQPNDEWEEPLNALLSSERASKAARFAMAIGDDAEKEMLKMFLNSPESDVFEAHDAREIKKFFKFVTMSVTSRTKSQNPDLIPSMNVVTKARF